MDRSRALDRTHRRILGAGVALSLGVHAVAFAAFRFSVPSPDRMAIARLELLPPDVPAAIWRDAPRIVRTEPVQAATFELLDFGAAGDPGAGGAPPPPQAAAPAGEIDAAVVPAGEYAFQRLEVLDPFRNGRVNPVAFGDLPAAEFTVATGPDSSDVPVYVPGSIGKAKRNWAKGSGSGYGEAGDGRGIRIGLGPGSGGHCPLPGKGGRPLPPVWKSATRLTF